MTAAKKLPEPTMLALDKIRLDGGTQSRAELSEETIAEYAEHVADLPPIDVFHDGETYWMGDGFHRHAGFVRAERKRIPCIVHQGTLRDAILFSVGANSSHGIRRTNADKRRGVLLLLKDDEWSKKSDRWIAEKCGVHHETVAAQRHQLAKSPVGSRLGQDGKVRKLPPKKPAPAVRQCPHHGCGLDDSGNCPACVSRESKGLPAHIDPAPISEPRAVSSPPPAPEKWECADCHSWWPDDVDLCRECSPADDSAPDGEYPEEDAGEFDANDATFRLGQLFDEVMLSWSRTEPLTPLIEWLKTKLAMTEQEAIGWLKNS